MRMPRVRAQEMTPGKVGNEYRPASNLPAPDSPGRGPELTSSRMPTADARCLLHSHEGVCYDPATIPPPASGHGAYAHASMPTERRGATPMQSQIWSKVDDKWATILMLRGHEVSCLSLNGLSLTLKRKVQGIVEALQQGKTPEEAGVKKAETLDARTIGRAEVSPGNDSLTLKGEGEGGKKLTFSTGGKDADRIVQAILAASGRDFLTTQEEIGAFESIIPPVLVGVVGGVISAAIYGAAGKLESGEQIEIKGRRRGVQQLMISAAETLGTRGALGIGAAVVVLALAWGALRIVRRPHRTVWLPETA